MSVELPTDIAGMQPVIISGQVSGLAVSGLGFSSKAVAQSVSAQCTDVQVKLFRLQSNGTIDESAPLATTGIDNSAKYTFDLNELGIDDSAATVGLIVKAESCDGTFLNRPITGFNNVQNIDVKSTVISQMVNAGTLVPKKLNEAQKTEIENLLNTVSGSTTGDVIDSLTTAPAPSAMFTQIFGASPNVIKDVKPEIQFVPPTSIFNEQQNHPLTVGTFHVDPNYSFVYKWKLDGVVRASTKTWNYIPHANTAGTHQIDVYVGKDDGAGEIDLTKPYYTKSFMITIGNNIQPLAPNLSIHASTPSPRLSNSIQINISTGLNMANCESFSHMALTESAVIPGIMQFNLDCTTSGTQTMSVNFDNNDGNKELHLWAIDEIGVISLPKSVNFVLDSQLPTASVFIAAGATRGGSSETIAIAASDATTGVANLNLYYAADNGSYTLVEPLETSATTYIWTVPAINTTSATLQLVATDAAGLTREVYSQNFAIDSLAPSAPSLTRNSNINTQDTTVLMTLGSCTDISSVVITETNVKPAHTVAGWQSCSTTGSAISTVVTGNGSHTLYAWAKDAVGNVAASANNVSMFLDTNVPVVISGPTISSALAGGASSVVITWGVSDASQAAIQLEVYDGSAWSTLATNQAKTGSFTWNSVPVVNTAQAKIRLTAVDLAGNSTQQESSNFTIDSTVPVATSLVINSGVSSTTNKNVLINFSGSDDLLKLTAFCLRYNNTAQPAANDSCWTTLDSISVPTSKTVSIANYQFQLGSVVGDYNVTVWWKNEANLMSSLSGTGTANIDSFVMSFFPDPPPTLANITAAGFNESVSPLGVSDTTVTFGYDLFIKWQIADNNPIPAGNISLYYTTNDNTYTTIATNLNNAINGDCTIAGSETGCYKWTAASPTNSYYRIKVVVTDLGGSIVFETSNPLNTGKIKFLSGNTSLGIGGIATNAVLFSPNEASYNDYADNQAVVVTKTGYVFYRSYGRGLVYVSPHDGIIRDVALQTGTASGDGGSVFNATFRDMRRMAIDYDDNVIIWDYNKVRKIDTHTTPWSISTLFGGGADSSDGAAALSASISSSYSDQITVTPNGRVWFNKSNEIWYFDPTDAKIKKHIIMTGTGTDDMASWRATFDNVACSGSNAAFTFTKADSGITKIMRRMSSSTSASCGSAAASYPYYNTNFDISTGVATAPHPPQTVWSSQKFTGLDGNIYNLNQGRGSLQKYNSGTNTWVNVVGNGTNGRCEDGTLATSCPVVVMSAFVSEFGRIYFVDLGVLRTVDSSGLVQTIAGQPRNFGIGYNPISARYSQVAFFEKNGNDIYVKNEQENQIVKFSLVGGNLQHIAGDSLRGSPTIGASATATKMPNCGWGLPCSFIVDSANNRLYHYSSGNNVAYIDLATGLWVTQGSGVVQDGGTRVSYVGLNNDGLLIYAPSHYGVSGDKVTIRSVNQGTMVSTIVYGQNIVSTTLSGTVCADVSSTTCTIAHSMSDAVQTRYKFDSTTNNWLFTIRGQTSLYSLPSLGGTVSLFETLNNPMLSYDFYKSGGDDFVFYCSTSGNLYKRNITTNVETALSLPIASMSCASNSLFYDASKNSLFFAYKQNNLYGIGEYTDP